VRARRRAGASRAGYTLLEVLVVVAILGVLVAIFTPSFLARLREGKVRRALVDLAALQSDISTFTSFNGELPESLDDLRTQTRMDPWGSPYHYLRIEGHNRGEWRKDRFLVPLNSDYDLYSVGPDGRSRPPLTAADSRDDVVRAGNGAYLGRAEEY
jgi:general secretion pathway protein G